MTLPKVQVIYDDSPVHCIDVRDGLGERVIRIRPTGDGGAVFDCKRAAGTTAALNREELHELISGLEHIK